MPKGHVTSSRSMKFIWLPYEPLAPFKPQTFPSLIQKRDGGYQVAHGGGLKAQGEEASQAWARAQRTGRLTLASADKLCVKVLKRHPAEVYGDLWWRADRRWWWIPDLMVAEGIGL